MRELFENSFGLGLKRVDAKINRSTASKKGKLLDPALSKSDFKLSIEPFGIVTRHPSRRTFERTGRQGLPFIVGQGLRSKTAAVTKCRNGIHIETAREMQRT